MVTFDNPPTLFRPDEPSAPWIPLLLIMHNTRTEYPDGLIAEIRRRFPSLSTAQEGVPPESPDMRRLADHANRAMLSGPFEEAVLLRAQFAREWEKAKRKAKRLDRYCIGGAFMSFMSSPDATAFPRPESLGRALRQTNPGLSAAAAESFAREMLAANDCRDFERAWKILEEAMTHGRTRSTLPIGILYVSRVAGLDVYVAGDRITVLDKADVVGCSVIPGFSDRVAKSAPGMRVGLDRTGRPLSVHIANAGAEGGEVVVPLDVCPSHEC